MPTIAIFAVVAIVLAFTAPAAKKPNTQVPASPAPGDDPTEDLLAAALAAYIKDKHKPKK